MRAIWRPTAQSQNGARRAEAAAGADRRAGRREPDVAAAASELAQRMAPEAGAAQAPPPLPPPRRSSVPSPAGPRTAQPAAACARPTRADAAGPSHKRPRPAEQSNGGAGPGLQLKRSRHAVDAMLQADGPAARGGVASPRAADHRGPASPRAAGGSRAAPAVQPLKRSRWAGDKAPPARGASTGANDRAGAPSPRAEAGQNAALFRALGGAPAARAPAGPATQRARCVVWRHCPVRRLLLDSMSATQHCRHARSAGLVCCSPSCSASCFAAAVGAPDALNAGGASADLLWHASWVSFTGCQPRAFTALVHKQWDRDQQRKAVARLAQGRPGGRRCAAAPVGGRGRARAWARAREGCRRAASGRSCAGARARPGPRRRAAPRCGRGLAAGPGRPGPGPCSRRPAGRHAPERGACASAGARAAGPGARPGAARAERGGGRGRSGGGAARGGAARGGARGGRRARRGRGRGPGCRAAAGACRRGGARGPAADAARAAAAAGAAPLVQGRGSLVMPRRVGHRMHLPNRKGSSAMWPPCSAVVRGVEPRGCDPVFSMGCVRAAVPTPKNLHVEPHPM